MESGGNDEEEDDVENPGKKRKKKTFDGSQFHLVQIELCKNTNLKSDQAKDGSVHSRKMTLRFIFVTPRQLIEKEGRDMQKMTRVNMYLKSGLYFISRKKKDRIFYLKSLDISHHLELLEKSQVMRPTFLSKK